MSAGVFAGIGTLLLMLGFVLFVVWVYSPRQRRRWDESAQLPFLSDPAPPPAQQDGGARDE